jgi:hypothetical protein
MSLHASRGFAIAGLVAWKSDSLGLMELELAQATLLDLGRAQEQSPLGNAFKKKRDMRVWSEVVLGLEYGFRYL